MLNIADSAFEIMPGNLLFCTSHKVTPELVRELQKADGKLPFPNPFLPARRSLELRNLPSNTVVDDHVELFDQATDADLQAVYAATRGQGTELGFVVLDKQSAANKTVVVHFEIVDFDGPVDPSLNVKSKVVGRHWETWRIPIPKVMYFLGSCQFEQEILDHVFRAGRAKFTDENGVFDMDAAMEWFDEGGDDE